MTQIIISTNIVGASQPLINVCNIEDFITEVALSPTENLSTTRFILQYNNSTVDISSKIINVLQLNYNKLKNANEFINWLTVYNLFEEAEHTRTTYIKLVKSMVMPIIQEYLVSLNKSL